MTQRFPIRLAACAALALTLAACDQTGAQTSGAGQTAAPAPAPAAPAPAPAAEPAQAAQAAEAPAEAPAETAAETPAVAVEAAPAAAQASGPLMADAPLGSPDAKVTVIEYASMTCPHCATFQTQIAPAFKAKYVETGLVQFIHRDFPLNDGAVLGAIVARCDGSPQKYHAFVDLLMRQQANWAFGPNGAQELKRLAQMGGLSAEKVDACIGNHELGQWILDQARQGEREYRVNSTPSFVINGKLHSGSLTLDALSAAIDPLLK